VLVFYFLCGVAIWLGLVSLRGGLRFSAYVRREVTAQRSDYTPLVSVIAPFRGVDQHQRENLNALFEQRYPEYEIVFVTDSVADPGISILTEVCSSRSDKLQFVDLSQRSSLSELPDPLASNLNDNLKIVGLKLVIAGAATDSGQKVHNLQAAIAHINPKSEVIVLVDSDARPHAFWLQYLVAPLSDENLGAATGYRWFTPPGFSFSGALRSVWNASITSALGAATDKNFCWGGSTAISRKTFDELNVNARWRGSISDDFTLTRVLHEAGLPIKFVPQCLLVSADECGFRELLEFTTRQLKITRVYAGHLWKASLLGSAQFVLVFFGGLVLLLWRWRAGLAIEPLAILLLIIFLLGAAKSWFRLKAVEIALASYRLRLGKDLPAHLLLWPLASALFLWNSIAAAFSKRINWRGISYELKSPQEAVIIARESNQDG